MLRSVFVSWAGSEDPAVGVRRISASGIVFVNSKTLVHVLSEGTRFLRNLDPTIGTNPVSPSLGKQALGDRLRRSAARVPVARKTGSHFPPPLVEESAYAKAERTGSLETGADRNIFLDEKDQEITILFLEYVCQENKNDKAGKYTK